MHNTRTQNNKEIFQGRLKKRPEFLAVAASGQKWVSDSVIVQVMHADNHIRYGVTATKRVGNAVTRNRCKRRLRAAMDEIIKTSNIKPADIVLIARHSTATCDWDKLTNDLRWCLKRLNLINVNTESSSNASAIISPDR